MFIKIDISICIRMFEDDSSLVDVHIHIHVHRLTYMSIYVYIYIYTYTMKFGVSDWGSY